MIRKLIVIAIVCLSQQLQAQTQSYSERVRNYIEQYKAYAIMEQQRIGIPAAITLGQGILETQAGLSELATKANNHFGIKCKKEWQGETFAHDDDAPQECFRKYPSALHSYRDHSDYLKTSKRYSSCFTCKSTDYSSWARELRKCGYATNPNYAAQLIKIIEDFHLQDYTLAALDPNTGPMIASANDPVAASMMAEKPDHALEHDSPSSPAPVVPEYGKAVHRNGVRGFYAHKGDVLLEYAIQYKVRYSKLLEMNHLPDAPLTEDRFITLERGTKVGQFLSRDGSETAGNIGLVAPESTDASQDSKTTNTNAEPVTAAESSAAVLEPPAAEIKKTKASTISTGHTPIKHSPEERVTAAEQVITPSADNITIPSNNEIVNSPKSAHKPYEQTTAIPSKKEPANSPKAKVTPSYPASSNNAIAKKKLPPLDRPAVYPVQTLNPTPEDTPITMSDQEMAAQLNAVKNQLRNPASNITKSSAIMVASSSKNKSHPEAMDRPFPEPAANLSDKIPIAKTATIPREPEHKFASKVVAKASPEKRKLSEPPAVSLSTKKSSVKATEPASIMAEKSTPETAMIPDAATQVDAASVKSESKSNIIPAKQEPKLNNLAKDKARVKKPVPPISQQKKSPVVPATFEAPQLATTINSQPTTNTESRQTEENVYVSTPVLVKETVKQRAPGKKAPDQPVAMGVAVLEEDHSGTTASTIISATNKNMPAQNTETESNNQEQAHPKDGFSQLKARFDKVVYAAPANRQTSRSSDEIVREPIAVAATEDQPVPQSNSAIREYHIVKKGETAFGLAKRYGLSMDALSKLNKLNGRSIQVGQKLRVR